MARLFLLGNVFKVNSRQFSASALCSGKKNFRQLPLYNFRGTYDFKEKQKTHPDPDIPVYTYGVREPGYMEENKFNFVPEMVPELIVPDLSNFLLKPYVSYKASEVYQTEFTAKDLFDAVYSEKIQTDYARGRLDENGNPIEPSNNEMQTAEEARILARKSGSDIF